MITGILGLPGAGKTAFAVWLMGQYVRAGHKVATNIRLTERCPFQSQVALLDDDAGEFPVFQVPSKRKLAGMASFTEYKPYWRYMPKGWKFFIDEADNYWDAQDFKEVADDVKKYFKQHRKLDHDIFLIMQNVSNVYVRIRRMIQQFMVCEWNMRTHPMFKNGWLPKRWSKFWRFTYATERLLPHELIEEGYLKYAEMQQVFGWYTSEQLIGDVSHYQGWFEQNPAA